ncbi:nitronate monooxygenase [uncultured Microbacterium sp.]|uniref:NAD(P)H-dependent flavin oxidoreductase n=1 Tax=uncultured Microbacterium sp. TaxID=191216 RepID=UPI0028DCC255|nr:nitronate monooxygenase [uncultured Microbacterium sp.]
MSDHRDLSDLLGIEHPIVLGPFGGLSSVALTAAVSEAGGLGSFGLYGYDSERIRTVGAALRDATARPFALNLWLPTGDEVAPNAQHAIFAQALGPFYDAVGVDVPTRPEAYVPSLAEQLDAVWDVSPAVLSVVFGVPDAAVIDEAHRRGIRVVGTATTVAEAVALADGGVDAIVATGMEAAGHRVSFLRPAEDSLVGTFALVPQVVDAVRVPVIAAGGIADRRGVAAARALGASAVQVGTAFLATVESAATPAHRDAIRATAADETVLTRAMSGRLARGARNRAVRAIEASGTIAPFPMQNWLTGRFRAAAGEQGLGELQSLWMGQAAPLARLDTARGVFDELRAGLVMAETGANAAPVRQAPSGAELDALIEENRNAWNGAPAPEAGC